MAGHPGLSRSFAAVVLGVLLAHAFLIDWAASQLQPPSALRKMAPVMYTRMVAPKSPATTPAIRPVTPRAAAVVHTPKKALVAQAPASAVPPEPVAGAALAAASDVEPPAAEVAMASPVDERPVAAPTAAVPEPAASAPASASPAPLPALAAASAPAPTAFLDAWPGDTRLNYRLGGEFRGGPLFGEAQVAWQRDGASYEVRVVVDITLWAHWTMTSQGEISPEGLRPRVYEEERRGRRRSVHIEGETVRYDNGRSEARPPGVQDTASQFVELGQRFATGQLALEVGRQVQVWLARPGGSDPWVYDVVGLDTLRLGQLGAVPAYHLVPRRIANPRGNISAEFWYAPSLQYLPVRVRLNMGERDHLDLAAESIEQR